MPREIFVLNITSLDAAKMTPKGQMNTCAPCELNPVDCGNQTMVRGHGTEIAWCTLRGEIKRVVPPLSSNGDGALRA